MIEPNLGHTRPPESETATDVASVLNGMNEISVVIPTLSRPQHLKKALRSILNQTRLPNEIIVVDQSDDSETENLISRERSALAEKLSLRYIFEREKGSAHARNVGWRAATGQIVFFVDDDMVLDTRFISEILRVYHEHPHAIGVQGTPRFWPVWKRSGRTPFISALLNCIRKVFLVTHWERDSQRVLSSGGVVVPYPLTKTIEAEVIYCAFSSFRKVIYGGLLWDENLKGYSWGEESFTIRLGRRYPHSLYVTPFAKVVHDHKSPGRPSIKKIHYIIAQYELYNFAKNVIVSDGSSFRNWIAFVWKTVGETIMQMTSLHSKEGRIRLLYTAQSHLWTFSHLNEVRTGKFSLP